MYILLGWIIFFFSLNIPSWTSGERTGLFNVPELENSQGFQIIKDKCLETTETLVAEACNPHRKEIY